MTWYRKIIVKVYLIQTLILELGDLQIQLLLPQLDQLLLFLQQLRSHSLRLVLHA